MATTPTGGTGGPRDRAEQPDPDGEHDGGGHRPPHGRKDHLLDGHRPRRQGGEQPVLDLVAVGELDDEREGGALEPGEDAGQGHETREEDVGVTRAGVAELGEDLAEHEQQEEWLQDDLGQEERELPSGHVTVTAQDGEPGRPRTEPGARPGSNETARRSTSESTVIEATVRSGG